MSRTKYPGQIYIPVKIFRSSISVKYLGQVSRSKIGKCRSKYLGQVSRSNISINYLGQISVKCRSRYLGQVSRSNISVNYLVQISVKCRSNIGRISVKYRSEIDQISVKFLGQISWSNVLVTRLGHYYLSVN